MMVIFIIIFGLIIYLIWYAFFRSALWVAEPLIKNYEVKTEEKYFIEGYEEEQPEDIDFNSISADKLKVAAKGLTEPIFLLKPLLKRSNITPQKIPNSSLWIYNGSIYPSKPKEDIFEEGEE